MCDRASPLKDEWWCVTRINEQMGALMEEKTGYEAAFDQLMSECPERFGFFQWIFYINMMR